MDIFFFHSIKSQSLLLSCEQRQEDFIITVLKRRGLTLNTILTRDHFFKRCVGYKLQRFVMEGPWTADCERGSGIEKKIGRRFSQRTRRADRTYHSLAPRRHPYSVTHKGLTFVFQEIGIARYFYHIYLALNSLSKKELNAAHAENIFV